MNRLKKLFEKMRRVKSVEDKVQADLAEIKSWTGIVHCPFCLKNLTISIRKLLTNTETRYSKKVLCSCGEYVNVFIQINLKISKFDVLCCLMCKNKDDCSSHCGKHGDKDCGPEDMQGCLDQPCMDYEEGLYNWLNQ